MATAIPVEQRFLVTSVPWRTYTRLLRVFADRPGIRLTFDDGTLELKTLSHEHEADSYLLARLIDALTEELNLPVKGGGSTTFRKRRRQRGLEPDACWWIGNEARVRGKTTIDLRLDPPPDLALEIDVTHSSLGRMGIYAALGVPEIWRYDGQTVSCHWLGSDGRYSENAVSQAFPGLRVQELARFLSMRGQGDDNAIVRQFRAWVRRQAGPGGPMQPAP